MSKSFGRSYNYFRFTADDQRRTAFFTAVANDENMRGTVLYDEIVGCDFPSLPVSGYLQRTVTKKSRSSDVYAQEVGTAASSVGNARDMSRIRLNQINLTASGIRLSMFKTSDVFPRGLIINQLFSGQIDAYTDWMSAKCVGMNEFRNVFSWFNSKFVNAKVDEITVFQPLYQLFAERTLSSLNAEFTIQNANSTVLQVDLEYKDGTVFTSSGSADLLVSANGLQSFIELKSPFSKNKGLYKTDCHKPRDQLVLEVHSKEGVKIGLLTDLFCSAIDICVNGHHHLSQRVDTPEECIQMLLLLCCSVTEEDIPANEQVADDYLTSTVNDDNEENDIGGSGKSSKHTAKEVRGSMKLSRTSNPASSSYASNKENEGTGKRRTVRYTADLEDAHADKLEQMQAFDAFRYGYRPLTNSNLIINTSLY